MPVIKGNIESECNSLDIFLFSIQGAVLCLQCYCSYVAVTLMHRRHRMCETGLSLRDLECVSVNLTHNISV